MTHLAVVTRDSGAVPFVRRRSMHRNERGQMSAHRHQLTTWESIDLLRQRTVGRLCIIDHGYPLAIPINYQVVGGNDDIDIVVRTAPETLLGRYEGPGSLEVDDLDLDHGTAWSVIVRGAVRSVAGTHNLPDPNPMITDRREQWVTLHTSAVSGRRFAVRKASDGMSVDWQLATA